QLFNTHKEIMEFDMSNLPFLANVDDDYILEHKRNWYLLVYETLVEFDKNLDKQIAEVPSIGQPIKELSEGTFLKDQRQVALFFFYRLDLGFNDDFEKNINTILDLYPHVWK